MDQIVNNNDGTIVDQIFLKFFLVYMCVCVCARARAHICMINFSNLFQ